MYHVVQKSLGEPKNKELENKTTLIVLTKKKQTNYIYYDSKHLETRESNQSEISCFSTINFVNKTKTMKSIFIYWES